MKLSFFDQRESALFVDLYDQNGAVIAQDLFGNLAQGADADRTVTVAVPLAANPRAAGILIRRGDVELMLYDALLYVDADQEAQVGTSDRNPDSDGDGLTDYEEVFTYHTDPLKADTDGDGVSDGDEVKIHHTNPLARPAAETPGNGQGLGEGSGPGNESPATSRRNVTPRPTIKDTRGVVALRVFTVME